MTARVYVNWTEGNNMGAMPVRFRDELIGVQSWENISGMSRTEHFFVGYQNNWHSKPTMWCSCTYIYIYQYIHIYILYIQTKTYINIHVYPRIHVYIYICIYIYVYIYILDRYLYMFICIYIHIWYSIYIHMCIYIQMFLRTVQNNSWAPNLGFHWWFWLPSKLTKNFPAGWYAQRTTWGTTSYPLEDICHGSAL